ncbi:MAG: hypothetical protein KDA57_00325 [Planctomycetales bacterium]|nr:hypothetical protein [Planctomycetales bacterium]
MFDEIASLSHEPDRMFSQAAKRLAEEGRYHQLFELRLVQRRFELGISLGQDLPLDELEDSLRVRLEDAYLEACREVGQLMLEAGKIRDAWTYLRPAGDKATMRRRLECVVPTEDSADELIALALHEGIDPERGFAWLLAQRGTCNAITELEGICGSLPITDQIACATVLVRHMHDELLGNLKGHLQRLKQPPPETHSIVELLAAHPELLDEGAYHVDTSHLATSVRFARLLTEPKFLRLAIELAEYGRRLARDLQYPDHPPFEDTYPTHLLLFRATLGEEVESALEFFSEQAQSAEVELEGTGALETYLILLERTGRSGEALDEYAKLVPADCALSHHAPTLVHLAQLSNRWDRYLEICQQRNDVVGFAAGQISKNRKSP